MEAQDTHFFVYNGKQHLIKFDFFKYLQEYFKRNQMKKMKRISIFQETGLTVSLIMW